MKKYLLVLGFFIAGMNQVNAQYYDNLNFNINDSLKLVASTNSAAKKIDILMKKEDLGSLMKDHLCTVVYPNLY